MNEINVLARRHESSVGKFFINGENARSTKKNSSL